MGYQMIQIKPIKTKDALDSIFYSDAFEFLKDTILDSGEADIYQGDYVLYKVKYPIYTYIKNKNYIWLGIYNENVLIGLQLILIQDNVELVVAERNPLYKIKIFNEILNYVQKQYNKPVITFPLNDKLKQYYMSFGFKEIENNYLILDR